MFFGISIIDIFTLKTLTYCFDAFFNAYYTATLIILPLGLFTYI
ncbi:putative membrane protein [Acinetobacter baumannii 299505]|nr:putative membrane protein [Acinetobacter baumannii 299505]